MKNPWLAAILNFFLFGGGTLYVGKRKLVGAILLVGGTVAQVTEIAMSPPFHYVPTFWPPLFAGLVALKLGLAADGWREAKEAA